jgi:hypothetical protein
LQLSRLLPADAGEVSAFAFGAGGAVYVGTIPGYNKGRVYKATAGGGHWRLISGGDWTWLGALAADLSRPGTLYAGTGNEVYKTTDGGRTWRSSNKGLLPASGKTKGEGWVEWLGVAPRSSKTLYAIDFATTFRRSVDGGRSWGVVAWKKGFGFGQSQIAWTSPPTLYAWHGRLSRNGRGPYKLTFSLQRFREGGGSWQRSRLSVAIAYHGAEPPRLEIDPRHPTTLYAAVNDRIFTSTHAGAHLKNITAGLPQGQNVTSLAIGPGTLYAALGTNGIWETTDGGSTWTQSWPRSRPAPGLGVGLLVVDPKRPSTVFAAAYYPEKRSTGTHVLRSTDAGQTWVVVG